MKWVAHFDNYKINQFNNNGDESLFQEVLNNIKKLKMFCLYDDDSNYYSVDMEKQEISYNGNRLIKTNMDNPMLLYYRRCFMNMGDDKPYVFQCLGIQNTEKESFIKIDEQLNTYEVIK